MHEPQAQPTGDIVVRHRVYVDAPVSRVFHLLTTAQGWNGWFTTAAALDCRPGGALTFEWRDFGADLYTATDFGRIISVIEDHEFCFTWHPGDHETIVSFKLEPRGSGCLVNVEERGYCFRATDFAVALQVAAGWGEAMTLFKFYTESGAVYGRVPAPSQVR